VFNAQVGSQDEVIVSGTVESVHFGRWSHSYTVTVVRPEGDDIRVPVSALDAEELQPGAEFAMKYPRGSLGLIYLP